MSQRLQVRLLSIFVLFVAWEYFGRRANPILFTYPTAIIRAFIGLVTSGELQSYMKESLLVLLYASILAVVVGVLLGVVMGRFSIVDWATDIYVSALYSMPMVAMVPLIVLWFGFKVPAKVIIVFLFMVFPILLNTYQGVKERRSKSPGGRALLLLHRGATLAPPDYPLSYTFYRGRRAAGDWARLRRHDRRPILYVSYRFGLYDCPVCQRL